MAKGDLTRAVRQTGGLNPVVAALQDIWAKKAQQDYYNTILDSYNKAYQGEQNLGNQPANANPGKLEKRSPV